MAIKSQVILPLKRNEKGVIVLASFAGSAAASLPTLAQTTTATPVSDVSTMITSLGGIATAVTTVVLGAMGVRMAIKLVNRVGTKG